MDEYETPSWGKLPKDGSLFRLEVLKSGKIVQELKLEGKDHFFLGRQPDICDFRLDHPSISRRHAVLQYRDDNALMLLSYGANGTFINKKECTKETYHRVYVGDFIKFGESTRLYIVNGPEDQMPCEYDSSNMQSYRAHLAEKSSKAEKEKLSLEEEGIAWGFREDAVNDYDDDENDDKDVELPDYIKKDENYDRKYGEKYSSSIQDSEVNEKDKKSLERIRKFERKIQNMQEEIRRIYMKEGNQDEGLTEGQAAAVERNDKRIEDLKNQIEALEAQIRGKQVQRQATSSTSRNTKAKDRERDMEEESLDTTAQTIDPSTNWRVKKKLAQQSKGQKNLASLSAKSVLTFEDLNKEWNLKNKSILSLESDIADTRAFIAKTESKLKAQVDQLDAYVCVSQLKESKSRLDKLSAEVEHQRTELTATEKLLKLAAPALPGLGMTHQTLPAPTDTAPTSQTLSKTQTHDLPQEDSSSGINAAQNICVPPEQTDMTTSTCTSAGQSKLASTGNGVRITGNTAQKSVSVPNVPDEGSTQEELNSIRTVAKRKEMDQMCKKAASPVVEQDVAVTKKRKTVGPALPQNRDDSSNRNSSPQPLDANEKDYCFSKDTLEGGDAVWCPPKNQTGDGKTALNAKYGY